MSSTNGDVLTRLLGKIKTEQVNFSAAIMREVKRPTKQLYFKLSVVGVSFIILFSFSYCYQTINCSGMCCRKMFLLFFLHVYYKKPRKPAHCLLSTMKVHTSLYLEHKINSCIRCCEYLYENFTSHTNISLHVRQAFLFHDHSLPNLTFFNVHF